MSISQDQVVDYIKNLKLAEVKALIETLEEELGVEASAPVMAVGAVGGAAGGGEAAEELLPHRSKRCFAMSLQRRDGSFGRLYRRRFCIPKWSFFSSCRDL